MTPRPPRRSARRLPVQQASKPSARLRLRLLRLGAWSLAKRFLGKVLLSLLLSGLVLAAFLVQNADRLPFLSDYLIGPPDLIHPQEQIAQLIAEERYAEAAAQLRFFQRFDHLSNDPQLRTLQAEVENERSRWLYNGKKFMEGLIDGRSDETIGQTTALVSDFLVIGDVRDLAQQGWKAWNDEEVDKIVVALSSLGVVATGAQVASAVGSASSGGAAAPALAGSTSAKSAIVLLKTARKLGKLPPWLLKNLQDNVKKPERLKALLAQVQQLSQHRGGLQLLAAAKDEAHLQRLGKFAARYGDEAGLMHQIYGDAIVGVAASSTNAHALKQAMARGPEGVATLGAIGEKRFARLLQQERKAAAAAKAGQEGGRLARFTSRLAKGAKKVLAWFNLQWTAFLALLGNLYIWLAPKKRLLR